MSTQASAELGLEQKLRADALLRVEELEESLLEKTQELQRVQLVVSRLQGEVGPHCCFSCWAWWAASHLSYRV